MTLRSIINDSAYYHSEEYDAESDTNSHTKVATRTSDRKKRKFTDTDTNNRNSPQKSLINCIVPEIIPFIIPLIYQTTVKGFAVSGDTLHVYRTIHLKEIVTDAAHSAAHVFRNPVYVSWHFMDGTTPRYGNTSVRSTRLTSPVRIGGSTTVYPTRTGSQDIISPRCSIGPQEVRDAQPLDTSFNVI